MKLLEILKLILSRAVLGPALASFAIMLTIVTIITLVTVLTSSGQVAGTDKFVNNTEQLQAAIASAVPGDTIYISAAQISIPKNLSSLKCSNNGTQAQPITVTTNLQESSITGVGNGTGFLILGNYWILRNFRVSGFETGIWIKGANHTLVDSMGIYQTKVAVKVTNNSFTNTISRNNIDSESGVEIRQSNRTEVSGSSISTIYSAVYAERGTCCGMIHGNSLTGFMDIYGYDYSIGGNTVVPTQISTTRPYVTSEKNVDSSAEVSTAGTIEKLISEVKINTKNLTENSQSFKKLKQKNSLLAKAEKLLQTSTEPSTKSVSFTEKFIRKSLVTTTSSPKAINGPSVPKNEAIVSKPKASIVAGTTKQGTSMTLSTDSLLARNTTAHPDTDVSTNEVENIVTAQEVTTKSYGSIKYYFLT